MGLTRRLIAIVILIAIALSSSACGQLTPQKRAEGPGISAELKLPDLGALPDHRNLSLLQLEDGLVQYVSARGGLPAEQLQSLYTRWRLRPPPDTLQILEADLNGDGIHEVITALNDASSAIGSGTIFVLYRDGDRWAINRSSKTVFGAGLHAAVDIDGDGSREIVWSSTSVGANTPNTTLFISRWSPGAVQTAATGISSTYSKVEVQPGALLIHGGRKGGWGAGRAQRERTDRYVWEEGEFRLVDQRFTPSDYGYHRLQDGILAEEWKWTDDAILAYSEAMEPGRIALFSEDQTLTPEMEAPFAAAVRTYARFRLALLKLQQEQPAEALQLAQGADGLYSGLLESVAAASSVDQACSAATAWAHANPDFVSALNAPRGWANPHWEPTSLCGRLPLH